MVTQQNERRFIEPRKLPNQPPSEVDLSSTHAPMRHRFSRAAPRGAVLVEYAFLLTAFAIPAIMGIVAAGVLMVKDYRDARAQLLRPLP